MFSFLVYLLMIDIYQSPYDVIQNGRRDLENSHGHCVCQLYESKWIVATNVARRKINDARCVEYIFICAQTSYAS